MSQSNNLPLLIFAHSGEAQRFIKADNLSKPDLQIGKPGKYYQGNKYNLLITGGGREKTLLSITQILTITKPSQLINLGIGGLLNPSLKINHLYTISTAYAYQERKPVYESFALNSSENIRTSSIKDCLTVGVPVKHYKTRQQLSAFADIVDMELWWVAYVAKIFGLPIQSAKFISDNGHKPSLKKQQANSNFYSQELYDWYQENILFFKKNTTPSTFYDPSKAIENFKKEIITSLHLTTSQKKKFDSLLAHLSKKNIAQIKKSIDWARISKQKISPKKKSDKIIRKLKQICFPTSQNYYRKLNELTANTKGNIDITIDPKLESSKVTCSFTSFSLAEWEKKKSKISRFPAEKVFSLLEGKIPPSSD